MGHPTNTPRGKTEQASRTAKTNNHNLNPQPTGEYHHVSTGQLPLSNDQVEKYHALDPWEDLPETLVIFEGNVPSRALPRVAFSTKETCQLLGGISLRSLRRLEQRGLLLPSRGLRTKLYSLSAIRAYLEGTL